MSRISRNLYVQTESDTPDFVNGLLRGELDTMAADMDDWKPGADPDWVNLDWKGDGVVDQADVEAKEAGESAAELYLPPPDGGA